MSSVINQDDMLNAVREKAYGGSGHGITDSEWNEYGLMDGYAILGF